MTKFVLACYGSRGDVEPSIAIGRELQRRGHDVRIAVPPDQVAFAQAAGLRVTPYGADTRTWLDDYRNIWTLVSQSGRKYREWRRLARELGAISDKNCADMCATLASLAAGADTLVTGLGFEEIVANVAEYYGIPLVTVHFSPIRPSGQEIPLLPSRLSRGIRVTYNWLAWHSNKKVDDTQRAQLGLPKAKRPAAQRIAARGSLELQAYDEVCVPGLATEWARWKDCRPFVGPLAMEVSTDVDDMATSWIAEGAPPICFGFGSLPVRSPIDTVNAIATVTAELGQRALICAGGSDFSAVPHYDHVKVVGTVNYATVFPRCRAVVHHGGAGTTSAGLRAGLPTLVLSTDLDQILWGQRIKALKVGTTRRLSSMTEKTLSDDLRLILSADYAARAGELATKMSKPAENISRAADLVENFARDKARA